MLSAEGLSLALCRYDWQMDQPAASANLVGLRSGDKSYSSKIPHEKVVRVSASSALLCAATFISRATSEPARGTFHRPAGGRPLSAARRRPAIPDRRAFPRVAHPRAV